MLDGQGPSSKLLHPSGACFRCVHQAFKPGSCYLNAQGSMDVRATLAAHL